MIVSKFPITEYRCNVRISIEIQSWVILTSKDLVVSKASSIGHAAAGAVFFSFFVHLFPALSTITEFDNTHCTFSIFICISCNRQQTYYHLIIYQLTMLRTVASQSAKRATTRRIFNSASTNSAVRLFSTAGNEKKILYDVVPKQDFGEFKEYSVIFTNRALNLMSDPFQKVMRDLNTLLRTTYNARKVAIIPG